MVFVDNGVYKGWRTMNPEPFSGFFNKPSEIPSGDTPIRLIADHPIVKKIMATRARLITPAMVDRWMDELRIVNDPADRMQQAGIIIAIFSQSRLLSLILIGNKLNDRSYSKSEKKYLKISARYWALLLKTLNCLKVLNEKLKTEPGIYTRQ
jgi:hypothetical protein